MLSPANCGRWLTAGLAVATAALLVFTFSARAAADHDPGATEIDILAFDGDVTGNTANTIGQTEACVSVSDGATFTVDLVVDQVPDAGMASFALNIGYDPAVVQVTGANGQMLLTATPPSSPFEAYDGLPDTDGDFRADVFDFSGTDESGEGVVLRLTLQAVGTGLSALSVSDLGGPPTIADAGGTAYPINNIFGGTVAVDQVCPDPVDLAASNASLTLPPGGTALQSFAATVNGTVENLGPADPVNTDAVVAISLPGDCTAAGGNEKTVQDISLAVGTPVAIPAQMFDVTCTAPSNHTFSASVTAVVDQAGLADQTAVNNTSATADSAIPVTAPVDLKVSAVTGSVVGLVNAGMPFTVEVSVTLHNNGPVGPVPAPAFVGLQLPTDCRTFVGNPLQVNANVPVSTAVTVTPSWTVFCENWGMHTIGLTASVTPGLHVSETTPANNSLAGSVNAHVKTGICGDDPAPAGNILQNLSPALIGIISDLTAEGTPVGAADSFPLDCQLLLTAQDTFGSGLDECAYILLGRTGCSLSMNLSLDLVGGSPSGPTARLAPVGVNFVSQGFDWLGDTAVPNGTPIGWGEFKIRTDGGLGSNGAACAVDARFAKVDGVEGGILPNVPDSNDVADLLNPHVWPNDLNAERALVESSLNLNPLMASVQLWSRMIVPLAVSDQTLDMNVLTWKVTDPIVGQIIGAEWVAVGFPGDAVGPDAPGPIGGNPDAEDPPSFPIVTCAPHEIDLGWTGKAGTQNYISCDQPGDHMVWVLTDPDARLVTGDEGPRSGLASCVLDLDGDGLTPNAEAVWGTNPNSADSDADTIPDGPDNCRLTPNTTQLNGDTDALGDACDNCPTAANAGQANGDSDSLGDACDNCPATANAGQENGVHPLSPEGDACEDPDSDGVFDITDNCADTANAAQQNGDGDSFGDACDNCPATASAVQTNADGDQHGDVCDNCPATANAGQENDDGDALGNACDNCPVTAAASQMNSDSDQWGDVCDNCPATANAAQDNADSDQFGDACDNCPLVATAWAVPLNDGDCDGFTDSIEGFVGTLANLPCHATPAAGDEPDPDHWPIDFNDDQKVTTVDVGRYVAVLGAQAPDPPYEVRYDLTNDGRVNTIDVGKFVPFLGKTCAP